MALLDFLFEGTPPPQATSYSSTAANLPDWWSSYTQGLLAKSNAIAAEPFQAFTGPRLAGMSPDQTNAYSSIRNNAGSWAPQLDAAGNLVNTAAGADSRAAADPFLDAAQGFSPTQAAQPYLNAASATAPGALESYMSPYTEGVVNRIEQLGNRNLFENVLPGVQDQFIGAGQAGSTRNNEFMQRAIRDSGESILGQQAQALEQGWNTAGQQFQSDQARLAGLGQTAGNLAGGEMGALANLGELSGRLTSDTAGRQLAAGEQLGALGTLRQQNSLRDSAALEAAGQAQQGQEQRNLDLAYQNFTEQRDYPKTQADFLNRMIRGLSAPTSTTTSATGPASTVGASPLAQLAGAGLSAAAISNLLPKARGGAVRYYRGGPVRFARGGRAPVRGALSYARG